MQATVRILPKVGSDGLTTRKVAELAGVSIGSFYQYFPNKDSLLATLMDFATANSMKEITARIEEIGRLEFWTAVDGITDYVVDVYLLEKDVIRAIYWRAGELGRVPSILKFRRDVVAQMAAIMRRSFPELSEGEAMRLSFISANAVLGVIYTMIIDETQTYSIEEIKAESRALARAYLRERLAR